MVRTIVRGCAVAALATLASPASAVVTMTFGAAAPTPGARDQFNFFDEEEIPGGTTPGGGTYNSQAFSDNNGPPGQTFRTPASASGAQPAYALNAIWLKGASPGEGNAGGGIFNATTTWGLRISAVNGTVLTPLRTFTGIPGVQGALGDEWFTWTFTGESVAILQPSTQYAFDVYSTAGWLGFDATPNDANYANGTAFNSGGGGARNFNGVTLGNLDNHGYDRTFLAALAPSINVGPGDVNGDGATNLSDYAIIKNNFFLATGATRAQGDLTGDGRVDLFDYTLWRNNAPPSIAAGTGVPEPAGMALAAIGFAALARRGRLGRRQQLTH
jgi:hypothetical protein